MSTIKARPARENPAFRENKERYLSAKDGGTWNTNASLSNLCQALEDELLSLHQKVANLGRLAQRSARKQPHLHSIGHEPIPGFVNGRICAAVNLDADDVTPERAERQVHHQPPR
jgi:hypothetical protein